jgi:toxin ParE1/3/4
MRKVIFSSSAKKDFSEIRAYVVEKFGPIHWEKIIIEWQEITQRIAHNPDIGSRIAELSGTGYSNYKKYLHKNAYAIYSFNESEVRIHMFIPSMRDFRTHVVNRIFGQ